MSASLSISERYKMQVKLNIGGIGVWVNFSEPYKISAILEKYINSNQKDVEIDIVSDENIKTSAYPLVGEDLFCRYYCKEEKMEIEVKGANCVPAAMIFCDMKAHYLKAELYPQLQNSPKVLDRFLCLLPIRRILHIYQAFLFHSSRIEFEGKAVLFSGASGIGKTTQALLWKNYENVPYLCNDRSIIRYEKNEWKTYGYFQDGSEPIADNKCLPLGAIVFLKQGTENIIKKIQGKEALKLLMEQIFLDSWDYAMIADITIRIVSLLEDIPVYTLQCLPEHSAIECLKNELKRR